MTNDERWQGGNPKRKVHIKGSLSSPDTCFILWLVDEKVHCEYLFLFDPSVLYSCGSIDSLLGMLFTRQEQMLLVDMVLFRELNALFGSRTSFPQPAAQVAQTKNNHLYKSIPT